MPFVNRFASPVAPPARFGFVRNHPIIVASSAATAGVLLGGFVAVQLLATPAAKIEAGTSTPPPPQTATTEIKAPRIAETTGRAPTSEQPADDKSVAATDSGKVDSGQTDSSKTTAVVDCDKQTWPNLSRDCMKNGGTRATSTDRSNGSTAAAPATTPATTPNTPPPAAPAAPAASAAATTQPAVQTTPAAQSSQDSAQAAAKAEQANSEQAKAKSKRVAKQQKRKPARQQPEFNQDDEATMASVNREYRPYDRRYDRDRPRRVERRWVERERGFDRRARAYDDDDDGGRRVIVIRRGGGGGFGGGGLFGSLFGSFGNGDD